MISTEELSDVFVEMADTLVADFDLVDFLQNLVDRAAQICRAEAAGLMLAAPGGVLRFMAATNPTGKMLELLQIQADEGPCIDCFRTGTPVVNVDLVEGGQAWPRFSRAATAAGYRTVHAFPLRLRHESLGALNLFGMDASGFEGNDVQVVQALADVATIALIQERNLSRSEETADQLQYALNSRIVIEQAKGALAQADGIGLDEAFELMRFQARSTQRRLAEVARDYLDRLQR
jgi:GAF domain-containing protein